jgi:glycosyltransferase involved in cell wall biosynthesis
MSNLTIVMPAYNEEESLQKILPQWVESCQSNGWELIIVNDGSTDKTRSLLDTFAKFPFFSVFNHKVNRGYGGALKTGILNAKTDFVITVDSDGQHSLESAQKLYDQIKVDDSDLIIGSRSTNSLFPIRNLGKTIIRGVSRLLLPNKITDLNSGLKIYRTELAKKFLRVCPNSMAFSDIITLTFIAERCKVTEFPIKVENRIAGKSKITLNSAFDTILELINIVVFFNPLRVFIPTSLVLLLLGLIWGIPIVLQGKGVSVGSLLAITLANFIFIIGLMAEQLSQIRKMLMKE